MSKLLLSKLTSSYGNIQNTLLYKVIDKCDIEWRNLGHCSEIRMLYKRGSILDWFSPRVVMHIEISRLRIYVRLPYYIGNKVIYSCAVESCYVDNGKMNLTDVFNILFRNAIIKIGICNTLLESLMLFGCYFSDQKNNIYVSDQKNNSYVSDQKNDDIIKVYYHEAVYFDKISFATNIAKYLLDDIVACKVKYRDIDIMQCFSGIVTDEDIHPEIKAGIIYVKSKYFNMDDLPKYISLKYIDVNTHDYDYDLLQQELNSARVNGNLIIGLDPLESFINRT